MYIIHPNILSLVNASVHALPSQYPAPISPDNDICHAFYGKPQAYDCQIAMEQLPEGNADEPFSYYFDVEDPNRLPLTVGH
ncbi:MAG: hypothetical protein L6R39_003718, partial [Caloplaca ligustica]